MMSIAVAQLVMNLPVNFMLKQIVIVIHATQLVRAILRNTAVIPVEQFLVVTAK
jgi:hypothetical protein